MPFRLDHISYATSHDQLVDVVQRLGSRIGSAFIDGGIHPRFGTRNFTLPLKNGHYLEVVCPLDHPAAEDSAFGKAVTTRASEGGGWMSWVVAVCVVYLKNLNFLLYKNDSAEVLSKAPVNAQMEQS
jgi:hypothetical protein